MMGTMDGKVAIVSGSGRGIGREIALKLAAEGASVVINDVDEEPAKETAAEVVATGGKAVVCVGSVAEDGFAERFVNTAVEAFGGLDIIINNAGHACESAIDEMTDEQWDAVLGVNLKAPFRILRAAQPFIRANPTDYHRKVVNISSTAGVYATPDQSTYGSAKAGVIGLTKSLAKEWGRYKVNVNAVAFGFILTPMTEAVADDNAASETDTRGIGAGLDPEEAARASKAIPLGRPGTPKEAAGAVYLLCTPESDYVNAQCLVVDAGRV
ncbi:SDR family NAD(P)-dependent oxidoreductase [Streptomyces albipurpureus]|uniref:SDR family oxidoreductase n=1 Tax=Streptomyces albipurpureus TaxID=2897419 RepID=A0ABT0UZ88_9ACTN|nr:SDR family oxidoreductase [Streptomyces sp. CWNU-1]MCM2393888.1 SDR family oxidoreductase [Streptomyces sp. CWNU-1]